MIIPLCVNEGQYKILLVHDPFYGLFVADVGLKGIIGRPNAQYQLEAL